MGERNLILIDGAPGSGKSRLGRTLAERLVADNHHSAEHVSTGDLIRAVGSGAITADLMYQGIVTAHLADNRPVPVTPDGAEMPRSLTPLGNEVVYQLMIEHLSRIRDKTTIILDGYPRYESQVSDFYRLLRFDDRALSGIIITETDDVTSRSRQTKLSSRSRNRPLTPDQAIWRQNEYQRNAPDVYCELMAQRPTKSAYLPIDYIDTTGKPEKTTERGLKFVREVLRLSEAT